MAEAISANERLKDFKRAYVIADRVQVAEAMSANERLKVLDLTGAHLGTFEVAEAISANERLKGSTREPAVQVVSKWQRQLARTSD